MATHEQMFDPADLERVIKEEPAMLFRVDGMCMEAMDIVDGGMILVECHRMPNIGDACLCRIDNVLAVKSYDGELGRFYAVSTRYRNVKKRPFPFDDGYFADRIYGAVTASFDPEDRLIWSRAPIEFPKELPIGCIRCENCSDPIRESKRAEAMARLEDPEALEALKNELVSAIMELTPEESKQFLEWLRGKKKRWRAEE